MRIESITLRNFRGVRESTITFGPGVTVVAGPNEVGKSSIAEAIRLLRTTKHSSRAKGILGLQPVGKDVGPEVELEFTAQGSRVWVRKQWLRDAATEIRISGATNEQLSGDLAHERLTTFLGESMDVDLFEALEVLQGSSLEEGSFVGLRSLSRALDADSAPTADDDELIGRIEEEYREHLTAAGRPRGRYQQAIAAVEELSVKLAALREDSREMDQLTADAAREAGQLSADEADLIEARDNLAECTATDAALTHLRESVAETTAALEKADEQVREAALALSAREELIAENDRREQEFAQARETARITSEELARLRTHAEELVEARDAAQQNLVEARDRAQQTLATVNEAIDRQTLAQLSVRLEDALRAEEERLSAAQTIANIHVDTELLERITARETDHRVALQAREAAAPRVLVRPLGQDPVLANGEPLEEDAELLATERTVIEAPGVVRVEVHAGALPEDLQTQVRQAREALAELLALGQVETVAAARDAAARRAEADAARALADRALASALSDSTLEELKEQHAVLSARLGSPDEDAHTTGGLEELRTAADEAAESAREAESALTTAQKALEAYNVEVAQGAEALIRGEAARDNHADELKRVAESLAQARAAHPDAALSDRVAAAQESVNAVRAAHESARAELDAANPDAVAMELTNAKQLIDTAAERVEATKGRMAAVKALLEDRAKRGIYDEIQQVDSELEAAEQEHASLHRRAEAARLLRDVITRHRDAAHARYVTPFAQQIERLGRVVFGADFSVEISPNLTIASRTLDGRTVPFESLSAGAREQLGLLGRLAAAALIDPVEGAPLILDDTLGFADDERLKAVNTVLNDVGRTAQIIVLTCQPGRFSRIGGAEVVHLPGV